MDNIKYNTWAEGAEKQVADWCPTLRGVTISTRGSRVYIDGTVGTSGRTLRAEINHDGDIVSLRVEGVEANCVSTALQYLLGAKDAINNLHGAYEGLTEIYTGYMRIWEAD